MSVDATSLGRAVLQALVDVGITEVVVAPGSRNAPLSFAAFAAAQAGHLRLHTRIDERSAGFLALGLTKQGAHAAVMCTSGTAVANLHPAVLEAAHAGVPLVVVTADRPARLRGTSANQTTDQVGVFGALVTTHDLADLPEGGLRALLESPSVVHLNVQLDDPLVPSDDWTPTPGPGRISASRGWWTVQPQTRIAATPRTVVVAGDDAGPAIRTAAEANGWPVLAEPTSGARTGPNALRCYRLLLDTDLGRSIEQVVVAGHPTLSRPVSRLLARDDVHVAGLPAFGVWSTPPHRVDTRISGGPADTPRDPSWLEAWLAADRSVARQLDALLAGEDRLTPYDVAGAVSRALPPEGLLVVGPSSPIRDLDLMAQAYPVGEHRMVIANRGLAGIDGVVSTATGAALARQARRPGSRAVALMGDVTFLHDSNGLVRGVGQPEPDLTIVVVNDDGGSIFTMLEQGAPAYADAFETVFGTPHGVDLAALCAATRTPHWRVESLPELEQAIASPNGGVEVVEARVGRDDRRALDERIRSLRS